MRVRVGTHARAHAQHSHCACPMAVGVRVHAIAREHVRADVIARGRLGSLAIAARVCLDLAARVSARWVRARMRKWTHVDDSARHNTSGDCSFQVCAGISAFNVLRARCCGARSRHKCLRGALFVAVLPRASACACHPSRLVRIVAGRVSDSRRQRHHCVAGLRLRVRNGVDAHKPMLSAVREAPAARKGSRHLARHKYCLELL